MAPVAEWALDTNMTPGRGPDPWSQHGPRRQQEPPTSTQTVAAIGPRTQTQPIAVALTQALPWQQIIAGATHTCMVPAAAWPLGTNMVPGG